MQKNVKRRQFLTSATTTITTTTTTAVIYIFITIWFQNHRRLAKEGKYVPGQYSQPESQ